MALNGISTLTIASGTTITKDFSPAHTNTEIVPPYSAIWSLNYSPIGLGVTNDTSYKLYVTSLGIGSAFTLISQYPDQSVPAGKFGYDVYGASIGIIKGDPTIDNYMAKAAAVNGSLSSTIINAATYKGTWDAFSDTPTLIDGVGTLGDAYDVTVAGTNGAYPEYVNQDWRIYNGATWVKVDHTTRAEWTLTPATGGLADKEARQIAKLNLAATNRAATGRRATYDITRLPTQYDGNDIIDNPNTGGLLEGRPWTASPVAQDLILFFDSERTDCYPGTGTTIYNLIDNTPSTLGGDCTFSNGVIRLNNSSNIMGNNTARINCQTVSNFRTISLWYRQVSNSGGTTRYILDARHGVGGGYVYTGDPYGPGWAGSTMYEDGGVGVQVNYTEQIGAWRNLTLVNTAPMTDDITLFSRYSNDEGLDVEFGACMIYSRAITYEENLQNFNQFKSRYGL